MDGIILINKEKGITSRDVVNKISKKINNKHVGHAGTLDPIATGLMIIGVGKGTKILDLLTLDSKEYIATVKIGIQTDTFDITGNITHKEDKINITINQIEKALNNFLGEYLQTVPKYSAVKINGKRLYEYARNNIDVELPQRLVKIYNIQLLDFNPKDLEFSFKVHVSKGTYIRSLINDIGNYLNIPMTMKELQRTKVGKFLLENAQQIYEEYKYIKIQDCLDFKIIKIEDDNLLKKVKNGNMIELEDNSQYVSIVDCNNIILAIYKKDEIFKFRPLKVF